MTKPRGWRLCSSARVPMWRGETGTCRYATINCEDSTCRASGSASLPFTTFSSPGPTGQRRRSDFSVRSRVRCLRRFWNRWSYLLLLCVHLDEHNVADPMIEAGPIKDKVVHLDMVAYQLQY